MHRQFDPAAWRHSGLSPTNLTLAVAIMFAVLAGVLETEPLIARPYGHVFDAIELGLGGLFAIEYLARLWSSPELAGGTALRARLRFVFSPAALIDLIVLAATLAPFIGPSLMPLRFVRLLRILRLAKLGRTSTALRHIMFAVSSRRYELALTAGFAFILLLVGATTLYWLEADVQPAAFGSIPRALWWAVVTLTTIGYGDVYPVTAAGKFAGSIVAIAGIGLIAMPTGILAAAFSESYRRSHPEPRD